MLIEGVAAVASAAVLGTVGYGILAPRSQFWGPVISRGDASAPGRVALTFDDGPHPEGTPAVLDALGERGVKAVFFVVGAQAVRWPGLVRRIVDEGHIVGNHSYDHHHFGIFWLTRYWDDQIARADRAIEDITGRRPAWFRPPMGFKQFHLFQAVHRHGHSVISFSRRAYDGVPTTPERVIGHIVPRARAGDIITLHDGMLTSPDRPVHAASLAIRPVIDGLRARGLAFARLDELIAPPPYLEELQTPEVARSEQGAL